MTGLGIPSSFKSSMVASIFAIPPGMQYWFWFALLPIEGALQRLPHGSYHDSLFSINQRKNVKIMIVAKCIYSSCILRKGGNSRRMR